MEMGVTELELGGMGLQDSRAGVRGGGQICGHGGDGLMAGLGDLSVLFQPL